MKVQGKISDYVIVKEERNRFLVNYDMKPINETDATWFQLVFYKKQGKPYINTVKDAILSDIDSQTDEKILTGYIWNVPKVGGEPEQVNVWLSSENQFNYKAAFDLAIQTNGQNLPVKFKFGLPDNPVYHTFSELSELQDFYIGAVTYINNTLAEGWKRKDSIDFEPYKEFFPEPEEPVTEEA